MPPDEDVVSLEWRCFDRLTKARSAFRFTPCIYVQTDAARRILRIGKAGEGLEPCYRGGTGYALDAAMHGSGNLVFVAASPTPDSLEDLERQLLIDERPPYNNQFPAPSRSRRTQHAGESPNFRRPTTA
jgi:hypothetical protein